MVRVKGKVALVTGAASGIGRAIAVLLAKEGAEVVVADLNEAAGREVADEIKSDGGRAFFQMLDVTNESDWARASAAVIERYGRLDVLVNNAGVTERGNTEDITLSDWKAVI